MKVGLIPSISDFINLIEFNILKLFYSQSIIQFILYIGVTLFFFLSLKFNLKLVMLVILVPIIPNKKIYYHYQLSNYCRH